MTPAWSRHFPDSAAPRREPMAPWSAAQFPSCYVTRSVLRFLNPFAEGITYRDSRPGNRHGRSGPSLSGTTPGAPVTRRHRARSARACGCPYFRAEFRKTRKSNLWFARNLSGGVNPAGLRAASDAPLTYLGDAGLSIRHCSDSPPRGPLQVGGAHTATAPAAFSKASSMTAKSSSSSARDT